MTTIGIIGAGEVGSQIARAAISSGYDVVIANSRGPHTLAVLIDELVRQRLRVRLPQEISSSSRSR
jgi:predicted dinucleotide-binding enzyme